MHAHAHTKHTRHVHMITACNTFPQVRNAEKAGAVAAVIYCELYIVSMYVCTCCRY